MRLPVGFYCSNYYAFDAFRKLLADPRLEPRFCVGLDERRFTGSGMAAYYYQGSRYYSLAMSHGLPSYLTRDLNAAPALHRAIAGANVDYVFAMGWPDLLATHVLDLPRKGTIGVHPSLLPAYRGGAPLNWQLIEGASRIGVSSFFFAAQVDAGNVIHQAEFDAPPSASVVQFVEEVYSPATWAVFDRTIDMLLRGETGRPIDAAQGSYRRRRTPDDGALDLSRPAADVVRFVNAQSLPFPRAFVLVEGVKYFVNAAALLSAESALPPGTVVRIDESTLDACAGDRAIVRLSGASRD